MKYISLFAFIFAALLITSCGAKEEEKQDLPVDNEIVDLENDTTDYPEFFADDEEDINPADSSSKETMIYVDDTKEIQVDPPVKEEIKDVKKEPVVKEEPKVHEKRFYIVVGSFKEYSNAQKLHKYFKDKGYYPLILPKVNEYNRVAISSYVEEANARKAIKKLRVDHNDLTFWLYKW
jgi:cell division protein FtsN